MSRVIDQRVVEMEFDNRRFERNVSTTMSTLDKLKQKLNLGGAGKSLGELDSAARKVNLSGLGSAVETVSAKFSAMQVVGMTALANITNSAVNAGKRIVSALTIDPIKTGFQEYETQINAVQTILANTESKGTTITDVNRALEELNKYADMTIYNFTEMTRNIGTFTAAGVDLDTSVNAIKGIANLAAMSGSTSQQASTAMYQLSQALASGTVKLMDWNSVVNAGMGGEVFQNALKETARAHGVAIDDMIAKAGSFRETLRDEWLTSEVLTETLQKFTLATEGLTEAEIEANRQMLKGKGYTEEQIEEIFRLGNTATDAATKVKTFTQLWEVLKESAQSGWAQTWKLLIGDFEEAKALLTPLADLFTGFINRMSDTRNAIIKGALASPFAKLAEKIASVTGATEAMVEVTKDYSEIVDKVIRGDFGVMQERWDKLTEMGYDWARVQNLVNEKLGSTVRHTEGLTNAQKEQNETQKVTIDQLVKMTDAQLNALGFTKKEIEALRDLAEQSKKTGIPIEDLIKGLDQLNGRTLLINSFKNLGETVLEIFRAIKEAWQDIFPPKSIEERSRSLYDMIAAFHKFTSGLADLIYAGKQNNFEGLTESGKNLIRTLKGVFAIIDVIVTITSGAFKFAFELIKGVLSYLNIDILDVTASIGDALVAFRDWVKSVLDFSGAAKFLVPYIVKIGKAIANFISGLKDSAFVDNILSSFSNIGKAIGDWFKGLKDAENIPKYIIEGLVTGLKNGISLVWDAAVSIAKGIYDAICNFLGIHSPSTLMIAVGGFLITGLIIGIRQGADGLWDTIGSIVEKLVDFIKEIDLGTVISVGGMAGILFVVNKFADAMKGFSGAFEGFGDMLEELGGMFKGLGKKFKAEALEAKSKAVLNLVISIGILAAAMWLLTKMDLDNIWPAVGVLAAITAVVAALMVTISKLGGGDAKGAFKVAAFGAALLSLGISMLLLAAAAKIIASIDTYVLEYVIGVFATFFVGILALTAVASKLPAGGIKGLGSAILSIGVSMLLMTWVAKIISGMTWDDLEKAGAGLAGLAAIIVAILAATKLAGGGKKVQKAGSVILSVGVAMLLLVAVGKIIAGMSTKELKKGAEGLVFLGLIVTGLIAATKLAGNKIKSAGSAIAAIGFAFLMLALTAKIIAGMTWDDMGKAAVGLVVLGGIITGLIAATKLAGGSLKGIGPTMLGLALAIGILAIVVALIGMLDLKVLAQGLIAVGILGGIMALMIKATRGAENVKGSIIAMFIAIAIMALAVAGLSMIEPSRLYPAVIALGVLMGMFALMEFTAKFAKGTMGPLLVMVAVIAVLAGALWLVSLIPAESCLSAAASLSIVLLALSASLVILSVVGKSVVSALAGVIALTLLLPALLGIVVLLAITSMIPDATTNALLLAGLTAAFVVLLPILALVGALIIPALLGIVALTAMCVPLIALIGVLALMNCVDTATGNVDLLIKMVTIMTGLLVILAAVGPMALVGVTALTTLSVLMVALGALAVGVGYLMSESSTLEEFLDKGLAVFEQLASGLGRVIGAFITALAGEVLQILPMLGASLSAFAVSVMPFTTLMSSIDGGSLLGNVAALSAAILLLTAAELLAGIASFLTGGTGLVDLGLQLSAFMVAAMPFIAAASLLNADMMAGVQALAETILILTAANVLNGLTSWFAGEASLAEFGKQLGPLGEGLRGFVDTLGTFSDDEIKTIECAANAIKVLSEAADSMPNSGGWLGAIVGENDMDDFGGRLGALAYGLNDFVTKLKDFDETKGAIVECAASAIVALADAASELPNDGGWLGAIVGENDIDAFGKKLPALGLNLSTFVRNLGTFDDAKVATVKNGMAAIKAISDVAEDLPNDGGFVGWICGENDIGTFAEQLPRVGTALCLFAANLGTFTDSQTSAVSLAIRAIGEFGELADADLDDLSDELSEFGEVLSPFAEDMATFTNKMANVSGLYSAISNLQELVVAVSRVSSDDSAGLKDLSEALETTGEYSINKFLTVFSSGATKLSFINAVKSLTDEIINGFSSRVEELVDAASNMVSSAVTAIKQKYASFHSAGIYLVDGFIMAINTHAWRAYNAAYSMASMAAQAAKEALGIASPSKVFYGYGEYVVDGFVNAIRDDSKRAYDATMGLGNSTRKGLTKTLGMIGQLIEGGVDLQPTIRPVLDLSDVRSGAGAIGSMFGMRPSVGVMTNIGAISSRMSAPRQNGTDDVVSAIDKLRDNLGNVGNTTYAINGITYNGDSDIANAVRTIARHFKIEGRV